MKVVFEYVAQMRVAAGVGSEEVGFEGPASVQDVINEVASRHGGRLAELLLDEAGVLRPGAIVFVGDEQIEWGTFCALADGARMTILAPLAGG